MTGRQLHQILLEKWGCSYDIQLRKIKDRLFLQIMWKYLEQASFPLSPEQYFEHLEDICNYLNAWGVVEQVKSYLAQTKDKPRLGKVVSIPLDLGDRSSEWLI
jgi:Domain of unknown function (DUF3067)